MMKTEKARGSARVYGGQTEEERKTERYERFLEAGLEVFGSVGFRKATVKMLCREAGLTERYFYEAVSDMESLFCAVYKRQTDLLRDFFVAELPNLSADPDEKIHSALDLFYTLMRDSRKVRVLFLESNIGSEQVRTMHYQNLDALATLSAEMSIVFVGGTKMPKERLKGVASSINGATIHLAMTWMLSNYEMKQEDIVYSSALLIRGAMRELKL